MNTITKKRKKIVIHVQRGCYNSHLPKREYETRIEEKIFMREEEREGIGTVAIFSDGSEIVTRPTKNYNICSRFIDRIFAEKVYRKKTPITKQNILKHVA